MAALRLIERRFRLHTMLCGQMVLTTGFERVSWSGMPAADLRAV